MTVTTLDTSTSPLPAAQGGTAATSFPNAYINLLATVSISGATVLDATAYGKTVIVTSAGTVANTYAITLPTNSAGKTIRFVFDNSAYDKYNITPASGTINGQSHLGYSYNEGCEIYCDGTNWFVIKQSLAQVMFQVTNNATQTINAGASTRLTFNTSLVNFPQPSAGRNWDLTNNLFLPVYPGSYMIGCTKYQNSATTTLNTSGVKITDTVSTILSSNFMACPATVSLSASIAFLYYGFDGVNTQIDFKYDNNDSTNTVLFGNAAGTAYCNAWGYRIGNI